MEIYIAQDERCIWDILTADLQRLPSFCGGKGICGKCKIQLLEGELPITEADKAHFTEQELASGYRLACKAYPKAGDCRIKLCVREEEQFEILGLEEKARKKADALEANHYLAVDIGTTTIAMALFNEKGELLDTYSGLNHQRSYGADIVSRIEQASNGKEKELQRRLRIDVQNGISELFNKARKKCQIKRMMVAGNTAMEHFFMEYPVKGLGSYPFEPYKREQKDFVFNGIQTQCIPVISGFVGGDIVSGLIEILSGSSQKTFLFLDLGTNGEMVLFHKGNFYTASTAAGPVFEGGNIMWGLGSVPGAICSVDGDMEDIICQTIKGQSPQGICGTGLIEGIAFLCQNRIITTDGAFIKGYEKSGFVLARTGSGESITITQSDIREYQLAKAAIAAGIDVLLEKARISIDEIEIFYLAGGFGTNLNLLKAAKTGLIPRRLARIGQTLGNAALKGCIRYCLNQENGKKMAEYILSHSKHIELAGEKQFEKAFIKALNF